MNDEAAESRGPATTGAGSSQDAPAPSAAPASDSAPAPADAAETTAPASSGASEPTAPTSSDAEVPTAPIARASSDAGEPTTLAAPASSDTEEPTAPVASAPSGAGEPLAPAADESTARIVDEPTAPLTDGPAAEVPPAWTPPAPGAPPSADPPPPPPPGSTPPGSTPPGSTPPGSTPPPPGTGGPPPAAPPPWFGEGGPSFSRERLVRPTRGRYVAGVCSALGRATNTDPVLWRVLLVVLGLFGGVGMLIYLIGWLVIPGEGDAVSPIESLLGRGRSAMAPFSVVLLGAATVLTFAFIVRDGFRATLLGGAVLVGVALLIRRNTAAGRLAPGMAAGPASGPAADPPTGGAAFPFAPMDRTAAFAPAGAPSAASPAASPAPGGPATATAPAGEPVTAPLPPRPPGYQPPRFNAPPAGDYRPPFAPHGPYAGRPSAPPPRPPRPPKPPRERSKLGRITFFAVLMVLGVLALIDVAAASVSVSAYFAAALATIGLGLLIGAWFGRARGLIMLALIATLGLAISSGVERFGGQVANSNYHPQNISQVADRYDFKVGDVTLDLRAVDFTGVQQDTTVTMDLGQVRVLLPDNVDTTAGVAVENGRAVAFGQEYAGEDTRSINITDLGADGTGGGTLRLTIQVKAGNVEVSR